MKLNSRQRRQLLDTDETTLDDDDLDILLGQLKAERKALTGQGFQDAIQRRNEARQAVQQKIADVISERDGRGPGGGGGPP
jgi:hypothetical protein